MINPTIYAPSPAENIAGAQAKSWNTSADTYVPKSAKERFSGALVRDLNNGTVEPDANALAEAVLSPGKQNLPKVQVKTFAVDGIQSKDTIFIQRVPPIPGRANIVLFIPQNDGPSFQSFKSTEEMNTWLKALASEPQRLDAFSEHFVKVEASPTKARIIDTMIQFKGNDINAVVGPYADEKSDIFSRLDLGVSAPPTSVLGLTELQEDHTSAQGRVLYSGVRSDGKKVYFEYDAYGNFQGETKQGDFYFVKNGLNVPKPLVPMTADEFKSKVRNESSTNVGANDIRGLYDELLTHLEHPSSGVGDALTALGIDKGIADTVERYLDNPFSALLRDINKDNLIGKVFGVDKQTMDSDLKTVGDTAQGFVPYYGQARMLSSLLAKALRNEPLSDQEKRDLADAMLLHPNSPVRKNLAVPKASPKPVETAVVGQQEPQGAVQNADAQTTVETPAVVNRHPDFNKVSFQGKDKYFVAQRPDAGDGEHYILRVEDPKNPDQLVSSGIIARPNESGTWQRRGVVGGGPGSSKLGDKKEHGKVTTPENFIEDLLRQSNETPGAATSITSVEQLRAADFAIPPRIYRAHTAIENPAETGLRRAPGTTTTGDDYLAAIIKHTARQGGSGGEVMSFSTKKMKAESFARQYSINNNKVPVYTVDTTQDPAAFRTVPDIILKDGERLVTERKITKATLLQAIDKVNLNETEVFYVKGDIPPKYLVL
jgi:hypothetical protein